MSDGHMSGLSDLSLVEAADRVAKGEVTSADLLEACLARLDARNAGGAHEFTVSHGEFAALARYFEPPCAE